MQVLRKSNHWQPEYFYFGDKVSFEAIGLTLAVEEIHEHIYNADMNEFSQNVQINQP